MAKLSDVVKNSIEVDSNQLQLDGDSSTPGNSKYYGTDGSGTKGFHSLPSDSNAFGIVAVSGQSNVEADSTNDTLTLAAGTGITITTTAGSDTVTVTKANETRTIVLTAAGAIPATTNGAAQSKVAGTNHEYYVCDFDKDTDESIYFDFVVPADFQTGNITVKIYWIAAVATTGDVVWNFATLGREDSEAFDSALGAAEAKTDTTDGTAKDLNITTFTAFNPSWAAGDLAIVKISRDANNGSDTLAEDARFLMCEIQYTGR